MPEKKLYKNSKNKKIFGVCAGIAEYFNIDVTLVRILCIAAVCTFGTGILAYIIAALITPEKPE
ncbi:MAG: PspC domain-containing protein [Clostridiales bacterium]|jgi:phage shock protein PspC (stress-responsive transcriptional regulator)|nr:PspC domain-containing protein [Clostridiales bacterium]